MLMSLIVVIPLAAVALFTSKLNGVSYVCPGDKKIFDSKIGDNGLGLPDVVLGNWVSLANFTK